MSNFGLTYRNSKWSDYALTNVSMKSKSSFVRSFQQVALFLFVCLVLFRGFKFYNDDLLNNELTFFLWTLLDATKYSVCFFVWSTLFFAKSLAAQLYSRVFSWFYSVDSVKRETSSSDATFTFQDENLVLPKSSQKLVFYSWLTTTNSQVKDEDTIERLYNSRNTKWDDQSVFFKTLYKASNSLTTTNFNVDTNSFSSLTPSEHKLSTLLTNSTLLNTSLTLNSDQIHPNTASSTPNTLRHLDQRSAWNLYSIESEIDKYNPFIKSIKGLFYLYDTNFNKLASSMSKHPELISLTNAVSDQNKMFKWNRWLYRYNILHRKVMKNAHKTTLAKKLISTGFLDSSLTERNLWASDFFSKQEKSTRLIATNFNSLYGPSLQLNNLSNQNFSTLNSFSSKNSLDLLNTYEDSYFYFVKRFYLFNTMSTNNISSSVRLANQTKQSLANSNTSTENLINNHQTMLSNLVKSSTLTNSYFNPSNTSLMLTTDQRNSTSNNLSYKDLVNVSVDSDLLNIDNLEILANLSNSLTNHSYQYTYFDTSKYSTQSLDLTLDFNTTNTKTNNIFTSYYHASEDSLLSDLYTLSYLIK